MLLQRKALVVGLLWIIMLCATLRATRAEDEAISTLERAENVLASSYQAVSEAERVGANVTALLRELNDAGLLLDKAYLEYRSGNPNGSIYFANISYAISLDTMPKATQLKNLTLSEATRRFWLTMVTSSVSIVAVILLSITLWRRFKRWYQPQDQDMIK